MRSYIDENDKKNEIRMLFNHPFYFDAKLVVVEGRSDIRLFRSVLERESVKLESMDGKAPLLCVMRDMSSEFPGRIVGICDSDHDRLFDKHVEYEDSSVYVTDWHDAEIMMINSPALLGFIQEYSKESSYEESKVNLFESVMKGAYVIGAFRYLNNRDRLNINFKGLNFNAFVSVDRLSVEVDCEALADLLIARSPNLSPVVDKDFLISFLREFGNTVCPLQICCGHDVSNIIAMIYKQGEVSLERNMDINKVEASLRLAYQEVYFQGTELYQKIKRFLGGDDDWLTHSIM